MVSGAHKHPSQELLLHPWNRERHDKYIQLLGHILAETLAKPNSPGL